MRERRLTTGLLLGGLAAVALVAAAGAEHLRYYIWSDRDLQRAVAAWADFPAMGAEMNGTYWGRVPGGAYYLVLRLLQGLTGGEPLAVKLAQAALLPLCLVPLAVQVRALWGLRAALMAAAIPLAAPAVTELGLQIWNPAISLPLVALATTALLGLVRGRPWAPALLTFALVAGVQVHLSNLTTAAGCVAAAALLGRRVGWRAWLGAGLVAGLLLAPYLISEAASGWSNTRLIMLGQGQPPVSRPHFDQLVKVLAGLAGSPESDNGGFGPVPLLWALRAVAALTLGCAVAAAVAAVPGLNPLAWRRRASDGDRAMLALAVLVAVESGLLLLNRNSSIYFRYSTPLAVPVAAWLAAASAGALARLERRGPAWGAPAVAALLAASWVASAGLGWWRGTIAQNWPSPTLQAVMDLAAQESLDAEAVRRRVVVLAADGSPQQLYMDYLLLRRAQPPGAGDAACIAVVPGADEAAADRAFAAFTATSAAGPADIAWRRATPGGWSIGYHLPGGNCWRGVDNPYRRYAGEADAACVAMPADGAAALGPGTAAVRLTFPGFRLCLGLELHGDGDGSSAVDLYSAQLRGYTGFPSDDYTVEGLNLAALGGQGEVLAEAAVAGRLGGVGNPMRPPWRLTLPVARSAVAGLRLRGELVRTADGAERFSIDNTVRLSP